ncbi:MAG TPA: UDP-2,3-diacylglucosamine diphosphatase [Longimicrobiales bacterium]|nr:UDP-2,3-diacylglucosamine diphosphatase [Longimicrobiales bacterium]
MPAEFIASDVHLGAVPRATERRFVAFLEHVGAEGRALLLNGDVFDFWFEYGSIVPGRHLRVLGALAALADAGVAVTFVGGNHDAWGGRYLEEEVGMRVVDGPTRLTLAGRPALVAHGDGLGGGDLGYRVLRAVIRSRPAIWGFRALHPELGARLARFVSSTEARLDPDARYTAARSDALLAWARERLAEQPDLHWVVCGHAHAPRLEEVQPGRWYANAGDWLTHDTYVRIDDGTPRLLAWPDRGRT